MSESTAARAVREGEAVLGIELGSTRIKAVLVGPDQATIATGSHAWENRFVDGLWTYDLDDVVAGVRAAYAALAADVERRHGTPLTRLAACGVSAMMHGYLALDADGALLTPFRTWRNTHTDRAAATLSDALEVNIPLRWSVAHLYQAVLDEEEHLGRLAHLTTLAGLVHQRLTGERVLGVGDASGMFPVLDGDWDAARLERTDALLAGSAVRGGLRPLLPRVLRAGEPAGHLTEDGARFLDPTGTLEPGAAVCPPEGDAGTGMVVTRSVAPGTGNVSAGTSIFTMVVLEGALAGRHHEIDLVTTPAGDPVAMVHCNNGASELEAWARLFHEVAAAVGSAADPGTVFDAVVRTALDGAPDGGGLLAYNYLSGEPVTGLEAGRPLVVRRPDSTLSLATFMRVQLSSAFATLRRGMDVLSESEGVRVGRIFAHGGLFTTPGVAQRLLAAALDTPVSVADGATEGGAWGIALLAAYGVRERRDLDLTAWLAHVLGDEPTALEPDRADVAGFEAFMKSWSAALVVERTAVRAV
ncbi:FGGY-family carbohydrate kinase [Nocardioides bruguierae]|uniref:FGGY-family carbohydrate kinase n=1 Tax=Nocardioides bruguierae TaxID=2945102 RepID=A0A9X2D967_9ACTN|nr:FGGY-family carbohydrate kinase [Nocardioides bruguierae]MCM0621122.1 FGGY-family carbohydrate kinase [Nocardioides bruguierae]